VLLQLPTQCVLAHEIEMRIDFFADDTKGVDQQTLVLDAAEARDLHDPEAGGRESREGRLKGRRLRRDRGERNDRGRDVPGAASAAMYFVQT
jgi:hypothetical protein